MTLFRTLIVILSLLTFSSPLFSAETLVKPETSTPIEICPSCKEESILLVPDSESKVNLNEGPMVEAAYFNGSAPRDATKFTAQWIGEKFPRGIRILLDPNETKQTGTYDLYLNLQPNSHPGEGRLKIQLSRPAASLEAIPKLIINRTYWFIAWSSDSHPDLRVTETSRKSGITISGIRPLSNSVIGIKPIGGTLKFAEPPKIEPGNQVELGYTLDGAFDLGTTTGTMKIDAPQLASPVSFDFEVQSRLHWIWIGITIFVALYISYLVKVKLQQTIELDQARLDAQKLIERMNREQKQHADPHFAEAYQNELNELILAMQGINAQAINDAKVALDTKLQKALQDIAKRHQDEQDALDKLHDFVTAYDWSIPPTIAQGIELARRAQAEVEQLINRDELTSASDERKKIISHLGNDIRTAAIYWQTQEQQILRTIQAGPHGIPSTISDLSKVAADLLASLHQVDASTNLDTPEQINLTLHIIQSERTSVKEFVDRFSLIIQSEYEKAIQITKPPQTDWNALTFDKASAAVKELTTFLQTIVDNPDAPRLQTKLDAVHQAWTDALQGQFDQPNGSVKAQLDARDYVQATILAVQQKSTRGLVPTLAQVPGPTPIMPQVYRITSAAPQPMSVSRTRYQWMTLPAPAVPTSVTDEKKLRSDKRIQSLILGALLVVAGYGLQLNTFIGTFSDFSTLFFWAFALDLTVDQVGRITKKIG